MIFLEEAHNVLLRHLRGYETVVEMILRQVREYGVGICLLDQHPSLMSLPALGTFCTIAFNLRTREDVEVMRSSLSLGEDADYLRKLKVGQAIVKLQDRYVKPFLVQFPRAEVPAVRIPIASGAPLKEKREISRPAEIFLLDIHRYPLLPVGERYRRLKLHPETGNRLRKELLRAGFVEPLHINTGKTRITLFEITELGRQYLREIGVEVKELRRRGSLEHQYWCSKVKEFYEGKGYNVEEEFSVNGGAVDLMVQKGDERILIEVETGRSDAVGNVRK